MQPERDMDSIIHLVEALRGATPQARSQKWFDEKVYELIGSQSLLGLTRSKGQIWHRARKAPDGLGYKSLQEMIYPPEALVGYGRANLPGSPVLYASWNQNTAYDELGALPGDYIQTIAVRPVDGVEYPCAIIGEYHSILCSGRSLVNSRLTEQRVATEFQPGGTAHLVSQYIDAFLADILRRPVSRPHEYKLSAAIANVVTRKNYGFIYPSVQVAHSMNIAVPKVAFDMAFEVIATAVLQIERAHGYGIYETKALRASTSFQGDGTIDWAAGSELQATWNLQEGIRTLVDPPGWRVGAPE